MSAVEVLMTTYNGEKYVGEQIDSILSQSFQDFSLIVSDDHSSDATWSILNAYKAKYPSRIEIRKSPERFGNARDHFFHLLRQSKADYVFFSDQDDVWFPDKMQKFMDRFISEEAEMGCDVPLLVFSDQIPTDAFLSPIAKSLMDYQKQNPAIESYRNLLFQNVVTGGAMALNRALGSKALECTDLSKTMMHDHWMAIVAACFGKCSYISESTSFYRQHGSNEVGAKNVHSMRYVLAKLAGLDKIAKRISSQKHQAGIFLDSFGSQLAEDDVLFLSGYCKPHSGIRFYLRYHKYIYGCLRFWGNLVLG